MTARCCLCRCYGPLETTDLPGTGFRCRDHVGCKRRVKDMIAAHKALADACEDVPSQP